LDRDLAESRSSQTLVVTVTNIDQGELFQAWLAACYAKAAALAIADSESGAVR
jgi:hypothetical protein